MVSSPMDLIRGEFAEPDDYQRVGFAQLPIPQNILFSQNNKTITATGQH